MTAPYGDYYLAWSDDAEAVTYESRAAESSVRYAAPVTVSLALRETLRKQERGPGGALLAQQTTVWHVPQALLPGVTPKKGDRLTDAAGVRFLVQDGLELDAVAAVWALPVQQGG